MKAAALLLVTLAACRAEAPAEAPNGPSEPPSRSVEGPPQPPSGRPLDNLDPVRGQWRWASEDEVIQLSILSSEVHAVSGCVRWNWRPTFSGEAMVATRAPSASPPCARPLTASERAFEEGVAAARRLILDKDGLLHAWNPETGRAIILRRYDDKSASQRLPARR